MIISFISTYWTDILLSLITAGALALCRKFWKELKAYRTILEKEEQERVIKIVTEQIQPIYEIIKKLEERMDAFDMTYKYQIEEIRESYIYRFNTLCKEYLDKGHITSAQLEQLMKFFKVFNSLGKDEEVEAYYKKALALPIVDE